MLFFAHIFLSFFVLAEDLSEKKQASINQGNNCTPIVLIYAARIEQHSFSCPHLTLRCSNVCECHRGIKLACWHYEKCVVLSMSLLFLHDLACSTTFLLTPPQVVEGGDKNVKIFSSHAGKEFAPEEISSQVLRKLSADASKFLNDKVEKAVITVPAYFNDSQRQVGDKCLPACSLGELPCCSLD